MRFNGAAYEPSHDDARLSVQYTRIFNLMRDGRWRTLAEIEGLTGDPPASISAQLRHMRKARFGSHVVDKRVRGERKNGLYEYCVNRTKGEEMNNPRLPQLKTITSLEYERLLVKVLKEPKPGDRPKPADLLIQTLSGEILKPEWLLSPSQLDQLLMCERKWYFQYVDGRKSPPTKAQAFGSEMHEQLEHWLLKGKPPASDLLMSSGALAHFPAPRSPGLSVEGVFVFRARRRPQGEWIYFWGFMDAMVTTLIEVQVLDLKTTSDLCWAKTTAEQLGERAGDNADLFEDSLWEARDGGKLLDEDTQGLTYALAGMLNTGRQSTHLKWVYVQTRGAKVSQPVALELTWEQAAEAFAPKFLAAERILYLRRTNQLTAKTLAGTASACGKYGGCFFRSDCVDISALDSLKSMFAQDQLKTSLKEKRSQMSDNPLVQKMQRKLAEKGLAQGTPVHQVQASGPNGASAPASAAATPATPPKEAVKEQPAGEGLSLKERMKLAKAGGAAAAAAAAATSTVAPAMDTFVPLPVGGVTPIPAGMTLFPATDIVDINGHKGLVTDAGGGVWTCAVGTELHKHKSRDKVIELARDMTPQAPPPPPPEPAKVVRTPRARKAAAAQPDAAGFTLYLDIITAKGEHVADVDTLLAPLRDVVAEQAGVSHYRLLSFNDGPKALGAMVAELFSGENRPVGAFSGVSKILDKDVLEVLVREADVVRKGVLW